MNPSATNLANANEGSSSALAKWTKTPTNLERGTTTMQNFYQKQPQQRNSIKCLEVLSKKIAAQTRQCKTRKGSRVNKTYDIRTASNPSREPTTEERENEKYFQKMEAFRRDKRNKYEQAVYQKLKEQEREMYNNNEYFSERDRHKEEIRRLAARRDDNLSDDES